MAANLDQIEWIWHGAKLKEAHTLFKCPATKDAKSFCNKLTKRLRIESVNCNCESGSGSMQNTQREYSFLNSSLRHSSSYRHSYSFGFCVSYSFIAVLVVVMTLIQTIGNVHSAGLGPALQERDPSLFGNNFHPNRELNYQNCPEGPPSQWENQLDVPSKAYLAPIVFNGKLISLSEDYAGRIAATFRVQKQIKNMGSNHGTVPVNLLTGSQVTLYFVKNKAWRAIAPHCPVYLNSTLINTLRPENKYLVFASSPLTSLVDLYKQDQLTDHKDAGHQIESSQFHSQTNYNLDSSGITNQLSNIRTHINSDVKNSNLYNQRTHSQLVIYSNYLTAFSPPEIHSKKSSRAIRRILCPNCGKFNQ